MQALDQSSGVERLKVRAGGAEYPVAIGEGLLPSLGAFCAELGLGKRALLVTSESVEDLYGTEARRSLEASGFHVASAVIPDGEEPKTVESLLSLYDACVEGGLDRSSFVVALGGGVVGDTAGFAAATYMRGIDCVQVPTTFLAQVDASIGGKTGVNYRRWKNLIGSFHQPKGVLVDVGTLATLPEREYRSGLAEVVKYGLIADAGLFELCEAEWSALVERAGGLLRPVVARCVAIKGRVVEADEKEAGLRAILNYGHTVGHAIEAATEYRYTHGEAVAIGMVVEGRLSVALGLLEAAVFERSLALLERVGLPTRAEGVSIEAVFEAMTKDKKARDGRLRFALLDGLGSARVVERVPVDAVVDAYRWHEER